MELPFREVYKCSWLKLPTNNEKKLTSIPKQWVIFCVHNDSIPFLEVYVDEKTALTHKPNVSYQLTNVLHITPSICPHDDDEYEFVITFPAEMVRLSASSQHQMMSWVKRLNAKLREMKLLAPSENLYTSHLPENRSHLLPTRDPNSPLPLPPAVPYIPPGVEPVSASSGDNSDANNRATEAENSTPEENPRSSTQRVPLQDPCTSAEATASIDALTSQGPTSPIENASTSHNRHSESNETNDSRSTTNNVTVIEVSSTPNGNVFNFNGINDELHDIERNSTEVSNVSVMPINTNSENVLIRRPINVECQNERNNQNETRTVNEEPSTPVLERAHENGNETSHINTNLYEHVFLPTSSHLGLPQSTSGSCVSTPLSPISSESKLHSPITSVNMHHASTPSQLPKMGRGRGNVRGRRRSNSNSEGSSNHQVAADRIRTAGPMLNSNQRLAPAPHPFVRQVNSEDSGSTRITLREQQVMQLRREMSHPGGVRLQLRRKDCLNSIALIDAFQAVWVAGWKQKEHPMLYTALHIGDQLISLGGKLVTNAADAQKLIRAWPSLYIDFVIRRIPCGRVYALRKEQEGQNLGIVQDNNTAEIKEIVPNSVVAAQGLTSRVRTMNGLSWTTWYISEVNGRPLNLFFKDNEVRDRLNAVGLDISLLVQPSDLIKQIKKQLKLVKNYKEYIVQ